jgi:NAD(P)-dependent dehydrogenase (short-subunit alcohol dehydrogenase family)
LSRFGHLPDPATALVVGASGGIGAALARSLEAEGGFRVIRAARRPERCEGDALALDLEDDASIDAFADALQERTRRLDLVLIASGLLHDDRRDIHPEKRLKDLRRDALERHFSINAIGPLLLAAALALLLPRRDPCVWATLSARVGSIEDNRAGGWYGYRGSKAAQNMFTRTLAIELGRRHRGLACVALHPGTVATGLSAPFRRADDEGVLSADAAADHLLAVIAGLDAGDTGRFLAWDGRGIPW